MKTGPCIELTGPPEGMPDRIRQNGNYAVYTSAGIRELSDISLQSRPGTRLFKAIGLVRTAILDCERVLMGGHLTLTLRVGSADLNGHLHVFGEEMKEKLMSMSNGS